MNLFIRSLSVKYLLIFLSLGCVLALGFQAAAPAAKAPAAKRPVDYVNALVGTAPLDDQTLIGNAPPPGEELYTGFTSPGAVLPHSSTNLSPVNKDLELVYPNHGVLYPYTYPRRTMIGFSNTSVPGMLIMPLVGDWTVPPDRITYASTYSKQSEKASAGYYTVYFPDHKIKSELTATTWTGLYRFTFPKTNRATILLDMGGRGTPAVEIVGDHTVRGMTQRAARGQALGAKLFFVAEFSKPFRSFGTFRQAPPAPGSLEGRRSLLGTDSTDPGSRSTSGAFAGCYLTYSTAQGEQVLVKVASGRSYEEAQKKLEAESPGWDFDGIKKQAEAAWSKLLNRIEVKGGTEKERMLFYSNLHHSLASPRLVARKGEQFAGQDGTVRTAEYDRYGPVPFWDTGRNQIVLLTLLEPEMKVNVLRSHLDMARESGYMSVSFHGDHAVLMYLGDWERGLEFDYRAVYEYLRKNAMDPKGPRRNLAEYLERGWIHDIVVDHPSPPYAAGNAGVGKTLEYSWDDYSLAMFAKKLGLEDDYRMFLARAGNYKNVFDSSIGFMRGRREDGSWISPFDPREPYYNFMMKEASGWSTLWLVPHDVQGLINLLGGRDKFVQKLDEFFTTPYNPSGICRDCTGMIGQYVHGNQPDQQAGYLYNWAGAPWKTQEVVRKILRLMYGSDKYGLAFPGMDDQGATSSWYVLSAMGFYPVDPARPEYIIGSPIFDEVAIHLANGKTFTIAANNNSAKNVYIQSATLNGKPFERTYLTHSELAGGGRLVFNMGPVPNKKWASAPSAAPPSMSR